MSTNDPANYLPLYSVPGPKTLLEMTWPEVEAELKGGTRIAIVTVGSVEPHGPHAPIGNDALLAREYARHTLLHLQKMKVRAVIAPPVHFDSIRR